MSSAHSVQRLVSISNSSALTARNIITVPNPVPPPLPPTLPLASQSNRAITSTTTASTNTATATRTSTAHPLTISRAATTRRPRRRRTDHELRTAPPPRRRLLKRFGQPAGPVHLTLIAERALRPPTRARVLRALTLVARGDLRSALRLEARYLAAPLPGRRGSAATLTPYPVWV